MIINHNINALNAHRNIAYNNAISSKVMEKLSSGIRINRAGDDAAGLSISEKMRGQIRGLDQAARNAQDGISLIQTAEGALNETHSILNRMRELSVQASNDTNTKDDREKIQQEINQLTSEIDQIGNTTEFNTKKLLKAGVNSKDADDIVNGLKSGWLEASEKRIEQFYGLTGKGTSLEVKFTSNGAFGELAHVGGPSNALELVVDIDDFKPGTSVDGNNVHGKLFNDRIIAHELTHAVMDDSIGVQKMNSMPIWFVEGTAEFIAGADERLKNVLGGVGLDQSKVTDLKNEVVRLFNGGSWNAGGNNADIEYAAGYIATKFVNGNLDSGKSMKDIMTDIKNNAGNDGGKALEDSIKNNLKANYKSFAELKTKFETDGENFIKSIKLDWRTEESDVGAIGGSSSGGADLKAEEVVDETGIQKTDTPLKHFKVIWPDTKDGLGSSDVNIQVGANASQTITIKLKDMSSEALGISEQEVSVLSNQEAGEAVLKFDNAIKKVSGFRSELGALQNRIEHSINNINNASENLTASESRVRDVDMAKGMAEFTQKNILQQAAQAMLAQANQQPQGVLQLLR